MTETVGMVLDKINPDAITHSTPASIQPYQKTPLSRELFDKGIAYLEAAKQENFSRETLEVWFSEMRRRGWTDKDFRQSVLAVMGSVTYGKVKFDDFLNNQRVYGEEEINHIVSQRIEQRKRDIERTLMPSEDELARMGLIEVQRYYNSKLKEALEKIIERTEKQCRTLRAQFYHLSEQSKIDLWQKAVAKGLVKDGDPHAMLILPFLVAEMIPEFTEAVKNDASDHRTE